MLPFICTIVSVILHFGGGRHVFDGKPTAVRALASLGLIGMLLVVHLLKSDIYANEPPRWSLVWQDEFDGTELDLKKWEPLTRRNSFNAEKQYYLPEQISVADGKLRIMATDRPYRGKKYCSGRVWTREQWSGGRFEARIKIPTSKGIWPAFWLNPRTVRWPTGGEIDIMENRGSRPFQTSSAYHWGDTVKNHVFLHHEYSPADKAGRPVKFSDDFHVFAAEWEPTEIRYYVDGELHFTVTDERAPIHSTPKAILLNVAVGGHFDGNPDQSTVFPQVMEVDYVRVWRRKGSPE